MSHMAEVIGLALAKFLVFIILMFTLGTRVVTYIFSKIAKTRSPELFTLTILAVTFVVATSSSVIFGTSIALGAFVAGMAIGKTEQRKHVSPHLQPLQDTFSVIFFLAVGMLFNPVGIASEWPIFLSVLGIILIIKPLTALIIVLVMKYPFHIALTIAVALAQIGEFSFILVEESTRLNILPDIGYDIIVGCALVSIALNPLLFKILPAQERSNP